MSFIVIPGGTLQNIPFSSNAFWAIGNFAIDFALDSAFVNIKKRYSKKECLVVSHPVEIGYVADVSSNSFPFVYL